MRGLFFPVPDHLFPGGYVIKLLHFDYPDWVGSFLITF
jgi:hypothetical protein